MSVQNKIVRGEKSKRGKNYIESGKNRISQNIGYSLTVSEMIAFLNQARNERDGIWNAIESAFYMGVESGYRLSRKGART